MFLFYEGKHEFSSRTEIFFKHLSHLTAFTIPPIIESQPLSIQSECYNKSWYRLLPLLLRIIDYNGTAGFIVAVHAAFSVMSVV